MTYDPLKYHNNMGPSSELTWVGYDLDGCLAESIWPKLGIGKPIQQTVDQLISDVNEGLKPIIFTSRAHGEYKDIAMWLGDHDIPYHWIITGKPLLRYYYDDKNEFLPWINK